MMNIAEILNELKYALRELKCLNKLALVGACSLLSDAIQVKIGTIFISRTSDRYIDEKVSALYLGQTIICITAYVVIQGITAGMCILCSQAFGAGNHILVGTYFMRALMIAALTCFPLWSVWICVKYIVYYLIGDLMVADGAGEYTAIFCFGYPAYIFYKLANGYLQSQSIIRPILSIMIAGNIINVCVQYLLVVVVPLEITGVALAYVFSINAIALFAFTYIRISQIHRANFSGWSISFLSGWYHFLRYGPACVLQLLLDVSVTRIVPIVLIGFILNDTQQFALIGILNVIWFVFSAICIGYGIGATVRIGNLLGENDLLGAKKATVIGVIYILVLECLFVIGTFSLASPLSYLFTDVEEMREQIEFGLRILSVCIFADMLTAMRGIFNACCLQVYATVIQFVCVVLIACPLAALLACNVAWRAASYYLILSIGYVMAFVFEILVLYCINWDRILQKVSLNTSEQQQQQQTADNLDTIPLFRKILFIIRYSILFLIGIFLFVTLYKSL